MAWPLLQNLTVIDSLLPTWTVWLVTAEGVMHKHNILRLSSEGYIDLPYIAAWAPDLPQLLAHDQLHNHRGTQLNPGTRLSASSL
jgi:hypothetical protein